MSVVICFPLDRQHGEVKRCAANLHRLHGEMANTYWRREMQSLAARLRSLRMLESEVSRQALAFTAAVQVELQRLYIEASEVARSGRG
jgi:hypothetical protein